jgi:para-nitrobenzyl esterase
LMRCKFPRHALALLIAAAIVPLVLAQNVDPTTVRTDHGIVRGTLTNGVLSWKGIPYAAPPVGKLRWRVPQPAKPWTNVKDATQFGPACMQADDIPKSEDCLTLNIWRPAKAQAAPLPVMIWIYGGAMVHGNSAMYPLQALAVQGVIAVSMNYRLGRLGFFAHPALAAESPNDVRGNYGYMDQLAALQWVRSNIAAFGGDPNQITLFGESAGGGSVLAHLISPLSRGLFQRAILQSPGTPGGRAGAIPSTDLASAEKIALDWSSSIGIKGEGASALKALRALPAEKLVEGVSAKETLDALATGSTPPGMAMSIIDKQFLPTQPEEALAAEHQAKVPTVVGSNDRDLPIGTASSKEELFAMFGPYGEQARKLYDPHGDQTLDELKQQVFADRTLVEPTRHLADEMARAGQHVWLYRFSYVSEAQRSTNMGALHGFEIPFTMNIPDAIVKSKVTSTDKLMGSLTSKYWVQFAKTGNPNGGELPLWPEYDPEINRILHFTNSGIVLGTDPLKARLNLWEKFWSRSTSGQTQAARNCH